MPEWEKKLNLVVQAVLQICIFVQTLREEVT